MGSRSDRSIFMTGKTILVVEDNPRNMKLMRALLSLHNCSTIQAVDAEGGINAAIATLPDLIIMDLHLPEMDGLKATSFLKNNPVTKHIPIVAVTSAAMEGDGKQAFEAGCDGYVTKPINTRTFAQTIAIFLTS